MAGHITMQSLTDATVAIRPITNIINPDPLVSRATGRATKSLHNPRTKILIPTTIKATAPMTKPANNPNAAQTMPKTAHRIPIAAGIANGTAARTIKITRRIFSILLVLGGSLLPYSS